MPDYGKRLFYTIAGSTTTAYGDIKNCGVPAALRNISDRMIITADHLYSSHLLILMSPMPILQNARMNVVARRVLVMSGMLKSMAARRIM